ncbi:hypothetical protein [Novosphingobium sp. SG707]|uniref:hypothetical protein n=1 Tax=Novosphingobium sp. SG707 TaxID=2586996 RepID=UPI0014451D41|nr:hypothetical protein [Novosphingobium sp. SG707]NKJ02970.1 hypothetical protein [Novosphingobium sp. SG707]
MTVAAIRGRTWITVLEVLTAAMCFMAITQIANTVALRGLALMGLRDDVPVLVSVTGCGRTIETTPLAQNLDEVGQARDLQICEGEGTQRVEFVATAPGGQAVSLLVNGGLVATRSTSKAKIRFSDIQLHPGTNIVAVARSDMAGFGIRFHNALPSYWPTMFGEFQDPQLGFPIRVTVGSGSGDPRLVGGWKDGKGAKLLYEGNPGDLHRIDDQHHVQVDDSGFGFVNIDKAPPGLIELTPEFFKRVATLSRANDGSIAIDTEACVPTDSALGRWAVSGLISPPELVMRVTGVQLDSAMAMAKPGRDTLSVRSTAQCIDIAAHVSSPPALVRRREIGFPTAPTDTLRFVGFGDSVSYSRPPTRVSGADDVSFSGTSTGTPANLQVDPDVTAFTRTVNARLIGSASAANSPSPIGLAWSNAIGSLPSWLLALMSGIAAGTPIILLILVIRRFTSLPDSLTDKRRTVLAGLYSLLLLALAAASQPFFFQIFYQAMRALDVWSLLGESRADGGTVWLDPFTPAAIALSFVLLPFMRAKESGDAVRQRGPGSVIWPLASLVAAAALLALLLIQTSPWQMNVPGSGAHLLLDGAAEPSDVPAVTFAAITMGLLTAWIPLAWALRALSGQCGFIRESALAGCFAVLLPLVSYAVEAARIAMGQSSDLNYAAAISLVSFLAYGVLPVTVYAMLLVAFRGVLRDIVSDRWREWIWRYATTTVIVVLSVLFALPRLIAPDVNAATADMGIIEILGIFQSFGLAVAAVAAISMLRAYAPEGDRTEPLGMFVFNAEEVDLLAGLFAGYLALWTGEFLSTAIAVVVGWFAFQRLVVDDGTELPNKRADAGTARRLVQLRSDEMLFDARRKAVDGQYSAATLEYDALMTQRAAINAARQKGTEELGVSPNEAKKRLLEYGPGKSPLENGALGALMGLCFGTVLQFVSSLRGPEIEGPLKQWAHLASAALADPNYTIAHTVGAGAQTAFVDSPVIGVSGLLLFAGTLMNASFLWLMLGFLFGFSFHRIRGDDGFVKALVFFAGVLLTYGISSLFSTTDGIQLSRMVPLALFLLFVGVLAFDARSLSVNGQSPARLPDVYGFRTSIGYVSLLGVIAAATPVVTFIAGLLPK